MQKIAIRVEVRSANLTRSRWIWSAVLTRTIIATGAQYWKLSVETCPASKRRRLLWRDVPNRNYTGDEVTPGRAIAQAAVFLAQTARRVYVLVRSSGLAESMSRYLIRRIEENPKIVLRTNTEILGLEGGEHLERVQCRDSKTNKIATHDVRHVFVMTGASPNTAWLDGCLILDQRGFIKTGSDLSQAELEGPPAARSAPPVETSLAGVFRWATSAPARSNV